ncbi:DUF6491 family protein [Novosphingopyxis sp.]|uniref:DUF6491 family protein n=1 Tax=Novosphingopyxis sp. TaxID=2709690 RepID=UPI003B5942AA
MARMLSSLIIAAAAFSITACAYGPRDTQRAALTPEQSTKLAALIDGKVARKSINCLPPGLSSASNIRISDDVLVYRQGRGTVYVNNLRSSCPGLARDWDIIVTEKLQSTSCSGDIIRLIDRTSGIYGGSCVLGEFTPYARPDDG